jgi:endonuclease/exonuclease/phosphatase family metal-dependent hydrolase
MKHVLLTLLSIITICLASCSGTAGLTNSFQQSKAARQAGEEVQLKVMSYNVHHCNPPSRPGHIDVDAIVAAIKAEDPDLLALQEIDVHTNRSGAFNQAAEIAGKLGMHFYFGKAIDYGGGSYGIALLSRYPMADTVVYRLPTKAETKGEPRVMATAKVVLPGGTAIRFGNTHLDAQKEPVNRMLQMEEIVRISASEKLPFVLAGDFNCTPDSEEIKLLDTRFTRTCSTCEPTIPVTIPDRAIDYIAFAPGKKFQVISHQVIPERYASDHLPVVAIIRLKK